MERRVREEIHVSDHAPASLQMLLIDGEGEDRDEHMEVRNPFTGDRVAEVAQATEADVHRAVAEARRRVGVHPPAVRAEILEAASRMVASRHEEFATAIMLEAGKPLAQARGEVTRCIDTLTFSAVEARTLAGEMVPMESARSGIGKLLHLC